MSHDNAMLYFDDGCMATTDIHIHYHHGRKYITEVIRQYEYVGSIYGLFKSYRFRECE